MIESCRRVSWCATLATLAVVLALSLAGCGPAGDRRLGAVTGFVTISITGSRGLAVGPTPGTTQTALRGATVTVDGGRQTGRTDSAGAFYIGGLTAGRHRLTVAHPQAWRPAYINIDILPGQTLTAVATRLGRGYYVMVGVDDYASPAIADLHGAENDVAAMQGAMAQADPALVTVLRGRSASKRGIERAIAQSAAKMATEDYLVFYFSGHGGSGMRDSASPALVGRDFICPWDSDLSVADSVVTDSDLAGWLKSIPGQRATVILDSCRSGSFANGVESRSTESRSSSSAGVLASPDSQFAPPPMKSLSLHGDFVLLAASQPDQDALEVGGHGLFTTALVDALGKDRAAADSNADHIITTRELYDYACMRLQLGGNKRQTPYMWPMPAQYPAYQGPPVAQY